MQQNKKLFSSIRALTAAAMLTAMSVIIGIVCKTALNFSNLPIILSGILFGPVVGGVVGAASDLISYLLSPQTYPPNLVVTLGALLVGVTSGLVARFAVRKQGNLQIVLSGALAHVVGSMIVKTIGLFQYYSWAVLVRIPLYLVIASLEILLLCWLFRRRSFRRIIEKL